MHGYGPALPQCGKPLSIKGNLDKPLCCSILRKWGKLSMRFDMLVPAFNSLEVSPRLCRGTHLGLTYTSVARESSISAKRWGFTRERVSEFESYEMGL